MPPVYYSFNEHHMDFPGHHRRGGRHHLNYVTDIGRSLAHHGFRKILLVNGHGSNVPFLDVAARNITNRTEAICAMVSWWSLIPRELFRNCASRSTLAAWRTAANSKLRCCSSARRPGAAWKKPRRISTSSATEFFYWDLESASPVFFQEWFSRYSKTGTVGDPTKASAPKGERFVDAVVDRMVALIGEFRAREIAKRVDHH